MKFPALAATLITVSLLTPTLAHAGVDATVSWGHGEVAVFSGSKVSLFNVRTNKASAFEPIKDKIPGLWPTGIDAAFNNGRGGIVFFKGDKFILYNIKSGSIEPGFPKTILGNWNGIWTERIGASVMLDQRYLMLLRDSQYIKYDTYTRKVVPGFPKSIAGNISGLTKGVSAAVNWNGKLGFFTGSQWVRVSHDCRTVDAGFPQKAPFSLPSVAKPVVKSSCLVDAAVYNSKNQRIYLFKGRKYYRYSAQTLKLDPGYPKDSVTAFKLPWTSVDAVIYNASGQGYYNFFKGSQTATFIAASNGIQKGHPAATSKVWPGVYPKNIGAAYCTGAPNWRAYFFANKKMMKFDMRRGQWKAEKYYDYTPSDPIAAKFWVGGIDAICKTSNYYFAFKGDRYMALDMKFKPLKGFPKKIKGNWGGL